MERKFEEVQTFRNRLDKKAEDEDLRSLERQL